MCVVWQKKRKNFFDVGEDQGMHKVVCLERLLLKQESIRT